MALMERRQLKEAAKDQLRGHWGQMTVQLFVVLWLEQAFLRYIIYFFHGLEQKMRDIIIGYKISAEKMVQMGSR